MSFVHWRPARAGEKKRAAGDRVFVQNFEDDTGNREWLECIVTALERNLDGLNRPTLEYQVKLVDGGALFQGGKWLSAARLHDKSQRRSAA